MSGPNFTTAFSIDRTPEEVFDAINNVRGWWSEDIEGGTEKLNDEFSYRYKDVHTCKIKLTYVMPGKKVIWHVLENYFDFTTDKTEWKGKIGHLCGEAGSGRRGVGEPVSGRRDLNPRPLDPQSSALPGCATPRRRSNRT